MTITLEDAKKIYSDYAYEPELTQLAMRYLRRYQAMEEMQSIPGWAMWTKSEADQWKNVNIGTPLATARTDLAALATLNLSTFKIVISRLLDILDAMLIMLWALARMIIALRDDRWP